MQAAGKVANKGLRFGTEPPRVVRARRVVKKKKKAQRQQEEGPKELPFRCSEGQEGADMWQYHNRRRAEDAGVVQRPMDTSKLTYACFGDEFRPEVRRQPDIEIRFTTGGSKKIPAQPFAQTVRYPIRVPPVPSHKSGPAEHCWSQTAHRASTYDRLGNW
jgi:hypothetical protein